MRESRLNRFIAEVSDHLGLSLLWLAGCLPLVTAPVATAALFDVIRRRRAGEEPGIVRAFLSACREQLPAALLVGYGWAGVGAILAADLWIATRMDQPAGTVLQVVLLALLVIYALGSLALFPVLVSPFPVLGSPQARAMAQSRPGPMARSRTGQGVRPVALARTAVLVALLSPGRGVLGLAALAATALAVWTVPLAIIAVPSLLATALQSLYGGALERLRASADVRPAPLVPQ